MFRKEFQVKIFDHYGLPGKQEFVVGIKESNSYEKIQAKIAKVTQIPTDRQR